MIDDNTRLYEIYATEAQIDLIEQFLMSSIDLNREYAERMAKNYERDLEELKK